MNENRGRQLLLSALEADERRAALGACHPGDTGLATMVLALDWFQVLTLVEVEELSSLPGWDWGRFTEANEAEWGPLDLKGLVLAHLEGLMVFLVEEADEFVYDAITNGEEGLAETIRDMRAIASRYGVALAEVWRGFQEDQARGRAASDQ